MSVSHYNTLGLRMTQPRHVPHFVGFTVRVQEDENVPHRRPRPRQPRADQAVALLQTHQTDDGGQPIFDVQVQFLPELGCGGGGFVSAPVRYIFTLPLQPHATHLSFPYNPPSGIHLSWLHYFIIYLFCLH